MMVLDIARQIQRLGWSRRGPSGSRCGAGKSRASYGSFGYTLSHADELDQHVMASAYDIGTGRITGFFTGGRADMLAPLARALAPVAGLGPFTPVNAPIVGTDNYDFMMQGVANLVANQESANYGPNYHARLGRVRPGRPAAASPQRRRSPPR